MKKLLCLLIALLLTLSFTTFAVDFTLLSSTVANGDSAVYVKAGSDGDKITLSFSANVKTDSLSSITMEVDGDAFTDFTAVIGNANEVDITFGRDLDYSSQYVIRFGGLMNTSDDLLKGRDNISFTTEAEPDIIVEPITLTKGIGSSVTEQTGNIIGVTSPASIHGFKVSIKNIAAEAKTVNIVCALYNANGIIKRVLTSEKSIDATATEMVELGTKIDSSYAGGFAKIFIWDNLSNRTPFVSSQEFTISN